MKRYVLDASAVMTFFEDRPGADKVENLLEGAAEKQRFLLMSVVNWGKSITPCGARMERTPLTRN